HVRFCLTSSVLPLSRCLSYDSTTRYAARGEPPLMPRSSRRSVQSALTQGPVDAHDRPRDYLTEAEFLVLPQGTRSSRYRWRNTAMFLLMFYHGLRVSELCNLRDKDVDLAHGRLWIARLKGSL